MKGIIGIFIPTIHRTGRHKYIQYLSDKLIKQGYEVFCFCTYSDLFWQDGFDAGEKGIFHLYKNIPLKGVVLYTELIKDNILCRDIIKRCSKKGIPVFTVERKMDNAYNIIYDYGAIFEKIVDHVIECHNARNIYMLSGIRNNSFSEERNEAYRRSLISHDIPFDESKIYYGDFWDGPARAALEQMLKDAPELPDAIVCANDVMAITTCLVLNEHNIRVPEDVIVTGLDGIERAKVFFPSISTSTPDYRGSTEYICSILEKYENNEIPEYSDAFFGDTFSLGQSCGCVAIDQRFNGAVFNQMYDQAVYLKLMRYDNDRTMLMNIGSKSLADVMYAIERNLRITQLTGIEIYIDPTFFDIDGIKGKFLLTAAISPVDRCFSVPFRKLSNGHICTDQLSAAQKPVVFLPLFSVNKNYGYIAAPFTPGNLDECERLYDLLMHLNIMLSSIESTVKLNDLYIHDQLTGLLNRYGFYQELSKLAAEAERDKKELFVISADMNGLKYINDTFGHNEGDFAISASARVLHSVTKEYGICARFGGDEYMVVMYADLTEDEVESRIRESLARLNETAVKPYELSMSIGITRASAKKVKNNIAELIKASDDKMFKQKSENRRNRR